MLELLGFMKHFFVYFLACGFMAKNCPMLNALERDLSLDFNDQIYIYINLFMQIQSFPTFCLNF